MAHEVEIVSVPANTAAVVRFHVRHDELQTIGERMEGAFAEVMTELGKAHVVPNGPAVAFYEPVADGYDVATGFHVTSSFVPPPTLDRLDLDSGEVAHTTHRGSYARLPEAYADIEKQAEQLGRPVVWDGAMWEEYWSEPGTPEDQTRTEVFWPVTPPT